MALKPKKWFKALNYLFLNFWIINIKIFMRFKIWIIYVSQQSTDSKNNLITHKFKHLINNNNAIDQLTTCVLFFCVLYENHQNHLLTTCMKNI